MYSFRPFSYRRDVRLYLEDSDFTLWQGDAQEVLRQLPSDSVDCCLTSPPYFGQRNYGSEGQIGLEETLPDYVEAMRELFAQVRRVLKPTGTLWLNLGDAYAGSGKGGSPARAGANGELFQAHRGVFIKRAREGLKKKDLYGLPWRVALALQEEGWWLRSDIIWQKADPQPEPVVDRPVKAHEYVFLLSKKRNYYFNMDAIKEPRTSKPRDGSEPGLRTMGSVWKIPTAHYVEAHMATMAPELARRCIEAGCPPNGIVLDPFMGAGTTALVARQLGRRTLGIELSPDYCELARKRLGQQGLLI